VYAVLYLPKFTDAAKPSTPMQDEYGDSKHSHVYPNFETEIIWHTLRGTELLCFAATCMNYPNIGSKSKEIQLDFDATTAVASSHVKRKPVEMEFLDSHLSSPFEIAVTWHTLHGVYSSVSSVHECSLLCIALY
jgi:hypothetical protein